MTDPASRHRGPSVLALAALALAACTRVAGPGVEFREPGASERAITAEEVARRVIDARDIDDAIRFLASDDRRGRATPSPGLERSAAWVAEQFQRAGLEPAGDDMGDGDMGFLQYWPLDTADGTVQVANVAGRLPGSALPRADEPVFLVAHLDHLGAGAPDASGDSIYNGADDNASGVAALVEVARAFAALPERPARPLVFLALSGEEQDQRGSAAYARHASVELEGAVAVLALTMLGRNRPDRVYVAGRGIGAITDAAVAAAATQPDLVGLGVAVVDRVEGVDPAPFTGLGVPVATVTAGTHDDHHRPGDEAGAVDARKVARIARLVFFTALDLAGSPAADPGA
jgi:hypothetical protein